MNRHVATACWLLCSLLLLSACTVQFLYNRLDWLIPWYIADYVDLTAEQDDLLERRVADQLHWHRTTQLPSYSSSIYRIVEQIQDGVSRPELDEAYDAAQAYWRRLAEQLTPDVASLLAMISDRQSQELIDNLEEKNREYQRKYVDLLEQQQRRKRRERAEKHAERWLGSVNEAQREAIAAWSRSYRLTSATTLSYRRAWHNELRALLAQRRDDARFLEQLRQLVLHPQRSWSEDYRRDLEFNRELSKDLILALDRYASRAQREHLTSKLNVMAYDFAQLASAE
jgi:hypothetical protein